MHALMSLKSVLVSSLVVVLLAGCGGDSAPHPSDWYATGSIYAFIKAVQDESGSVTTTVQLRDGSDIATARYLYLDGSDTLYATLDIPPRQYMSFSGDLFNNSLVTSQNLKVMSSRNLFTDHLLFSSVTSGKPEYFSVDASAAGSSTVRAYVDLERSGNVMVGESSIELPPAFQITTPLAAASVSRTSPPVLTWTPVDATSNMLLDIAYLCADNSNGTLSFDLGVDTGSAVLDAAHFPTPPTNPSSSCQVAFKLQRVRTGSISANFALGTFTGVQQRAVRFTTIP
jgi:hypothetical protein